MLEFTCSHHKHSEDTVLLHSWQRNIAPYVRWTSPSLYGGSTKEVQATATHQRILAGANVEEQAKEPQRLSPLATHI